MIRINLLEYREIAKREQVNKQLMLVLVFFIISCTISGIWSKSKTKKIEGLTRTHQAKQNELIKLKAEVRKVTIAEEKEIRLNKMLSIINTLKQTQSTISKVLDDINVLLPREIWLTSISQKDQKFNLKGYSFSNPGIAALMKNLGKSPLIRNIELISSEQSSIKGDKLQKFTITCSINIKPKEG